MPWTRQMILVFPFIETFSYPPALVLPSRTHFLSATDLHRGMASLQAGATDKDSVWKDKGI